MDVFIVAVYIVHDALKGICRIIATERERLKHALEQDSCASPPYGSGVSGGYGGGGGVGGGGANGAYVQYLKQSLAEVRQ